jgi:hypothetical protein
MMRKRLTRAALILAALTLLAWPAPIQAGIACSGLNFSPTAFAFESITVSTSSIGFTAATMAPSGAQPATYANCTLETNPIRFRSDGLAPSSTVGQLVGTGSNIEVCGQANLNALRFIRQGAADGTLQCHYYR